ncbi:hypothetical protein [Herbiconiux sp. A18JL235]|uniref:Uncharacterized protein n=1 Tax=Herbiconiux sp. A18JL235 TaxID=3152363 RepID=A0AB39BDT6_9MICO
MGEELPRRVRVEWVGWLVRNRGVPSLAAPVIAAVAVIVVVAEPGPPLLYIAVLTAILAVGSLLRLRADGRRARAVLQAMTRRGARDVALARSSEEFVRVASLLLGKEVPVTTDEHLAATLDATGIAVWRWEAGEAVLVVRGPWSDVESCAPVVVSTTLAEERAVGLRMRRPGAPVVLPLSFHTRGH